MRLTRKFLIVISLGGSLAALPCLAQTESGAQPGSSPSRSTPDQGEQSHMGSGEQGHMGTGEQGNMGTGEQGNMGTGEQGEIDTGNPGNVGSGLPDHSTWDTEVQESEMEQGGSQ